MGRAFMKPTSMVRQRLLVLALSAAATLALPGRALAQDGPAVPSLAWKACAKKAQRGFDCATARAPLDYDRPAGPADPTRRHPPCRNRLG
jgi:hypothetical protein